MTSVLGSRDLADVVVIDEPSSPSPADGRDGHGRPRRRGGRRRFRRLRIVAYILVVAMVPIGYSYIGYLTAPGDEPFNVRTVDWLRDHGFESVVNDVE